MAVGGDDGVARRLHRRSLSTVRMVDSPSNAGGDVPARHVDHYRDAVGVISARAVGSEPTHIVDLACSATGMVRSFCAYEPALRSR
jgi:hypothetical protein